MAGVQLTSALHFCSLGRQFRITLREDASWDLSLIIRNRFPSGAISQLMGPVRIPVSTMSVLNSPSATVGCGRERNHIDFAEARFVGGVCHPAPVGRKLTLIFVRRSVGQYQRAPIPGHRERGTGQPIRWQD